jgi:glucose-1-phosphate thymidylyltransferase
VLSKGLVVVPDSACWTGPWLGATRTPSLQRVANRPIICHVLEALLEAGVTEAAVAAPLEMAADIAQCVEVEGPAGIAVRHLVDRQVPGDRGALLAAAEFVGAAGCVMHRADGVLGEPLSPTVELAGGHDALLVMDGRAPETARLRLVAFGEANTAEHAAPALAGTGVAGACVLGAGVLRDLLSRDASPGLLDFAAIAEEVARGGGGTRVQSARRWRHFAGDALDLLDMNRALLDMLSAEATAIPGDGNRFEGNIAIHPTARVSASTIIGPVMIGADSVVSDSYIGPHTAIAERVCIEGAELERSIVLADASVLHLGGRLVASIIGTKARIFRDFSMPRALRLRVGDGDELALC